MEYELSDIFEVNEAQLDLISLRGSPFISDQLEPMQLHLLSNYQEINWHNWDMVNEIVRNEHIQENCNVAFVFEIVLVFDVKPEEKIDGASEEN